MEKIYYVDDILEESNWSDSYQPCGWFFDDDDGCYHGPFRSREDAERRMRIYELEQISNLQRPK